MLAFLLGCTIGLLYITIKFYSEVVMNNAQEKSPEKANAAVAPQHNMIHDVLIANTHLLHDKFIGILAYILGSFGNHGILSMVFTEEYPKTEDKENVLARYHADVCGMVINLLAHFEMTDEVLKKGSKLSPWAYLWNNLIRTPLHEAHHADAYRQASMIYQVNMDQAAEDEAEIYSKMLIIELAKKIDIEPPPFGEVPYFGISIEELHEEIMGSDEPWAVDQKVMLQEGLVYYDSETGVKCKTLREYFKLVDGTEDEEWQKQVTTMTGMMDAMNKESDLQQAEDIKPVNTVDENPNMETVQTNNVSPVDEKSVEDEAEPVKVSPSENARVVVAQADLSDTSPPADLDDEGVPFNPYEDGGSTVVDEAAAPVVEQVVAAVAAAPVVTTSAPAPGAATAAAPMPQLTPHNLTPDQMKACLQAVLLRLYVHVFNKCGFTPNSDQGFSNAAAAIEPVYVGDIPGVSDLFVANDVVENGQLVEKPIDGHITGRVMPKTGLPGYHIWVNMGGMKVKRTFVPQNPNKKDPQGNLKKWSLDARAGNMIAMLLDDTGVRVKISCPPTGGAPNYEFDPFAGR